MAKTSRWVVIWHIPWFTFKWEIFLVVVSSYFSFPCALLFCFTECIQSFTYNFFFSITDWYLILLEDTQKLWRCRYVWYLMLISEIQTQICIGVLTRMFITHILMQLPVGRLTRCETSTSHKIPNLTKHPFILFGSRWYRFEIEQIVVGVHQIRANIDVKII